MPGGHATREQKQAYRSAFTLARIVDELWVLIGLTWFAAWAAWLDWRGFWSIVVYLGGAGALGLATRRWLPSVLRETMPQELSDSLVDDPFGGPSSPRAPKTYRERVRRWAQRA
jgi:hypothetical protein